MAHTTKLILTTALASALGCADGTAPETTFQGEISYTDYEGEGCGEVTDLDHSVGCLYPQAMGTIARSFVDGAQSASTQTPHTCYTELMAYFPLSRAGSLWEAEHARRIGHPVPTGEEAPEETDIEFDAKLSKLRMINVIDGQDVQCISAYFHGYPGTYRQKDQLESWCGMETALELASLTPEEERAQDAGDIGLAYLLLKTRQAAENMNEIVGQEDDRAGRDRRLGTDADWYVIENRFEEDPKSVPAYALISAADTAFEVTQDSCLVDSFDVSVKDGADVLVEGSYDFDVGFGIGQKARCGLNGGEELEGRLNLKLLAEVDELSIDGVDCGDRRRRSRGEEVTCQVIGSSVGATEHTIVAKVDGYEHSGTFSTICPE